MWLSDFDKYIYILLHMYLDTLWKHNNYNAFLGLHLLDQLLILPHNLIFIKTFPNIHYKLYYWIFIHSKDSMFQLFRRGNIELKLIWKYFIEYYLLFKIKINVKCKIRRKWYFFLIKWGDKEHSKKFFQRFPFNLVELYQFLFENRDKIVVVVFTAFTVLTVSRLNGGCI